MNRINTACCAVSFLAIAFYPGLATAQKSEAVLLQDSTLFGQLVGYAFSCGVTPEAVENFVSANLLNYMPKMPDEALNARMETAFDTAMREAATQQPASGCTAIIARVTPNPN